METAACDREAAVSCYLDDGAKIVIFHKNKKILFSSFKMPSDSVLL